LGLKKKINANARFLSFSTNCVEYFTISVEYFRLFVLGIYFTKHCQLVGVI